MSISILAFAPTYSELQCFGPLFNVLDPGSSISTFKAPNFLVFQRFRFIFSAFLSQSFLISIFFTFSVFQNFKLSGFTSNVR